MKRGVQRLGSGASGPLRGEQTGGLITQDAHARFQQAVLDGNVWIGANAFGTPVTPQVGLSATTPPLILYNPINSPVNLVLWTFTCAITTVQAVNTSIMLAYNVATAAGVPTGPVTTLTIARVTNAMLGAGSLLAGGGGQGGAPFAACYSAATLNAAPIAFRYSFNLTFNSSTAASVSVSGLGSGVDHIDGEAVIPPGVAVSVQASAATPLVASLTWEEVLVNP